MGRSWTTTWSVLGPIRNECADQVLVRASDIEDPDIDCEVVRVFLNRATSVKPRKIMWRWDNWHEDVKAIATDHSGKRFGGLRDAILDTDPQLCPQWLRGHL